MSRLKDTPDTTGVQDTRVAPQTLPLPPASETGAEITPSAVGVDWLAFTLKGERKPTEVAQRLGYSVQGDFTSADRGMFGYASMLVGPAASKVMWSEGRAEVHVELPGQWCRAVAQEDMQALLVDLLCEGASWTRIDFAMDDFERLVLPADVYAFSKAGEIVTHCSRENISYQENLAEGQTFKLGRRGSRQYLRVYDKAVESSGAVPSVRWELEARDEAAGSLATALASGGDWAELFAARLVHFVDFRQVEGENVTRRERSPWFMALVGLARKAVVYGPQPIRTLEQVKEWLIRQVAPSLALAFKGLADGWGFLGELLEEGEARWKPQHRVMLAVAGVS